MKKSTKTFLKKTGHVLLAMTLFVGAIPTQAIYVEANGIEEIKAPNDEPIDNEDSSKATTEIKTEVYTENSSQESTEQPSVENTQKGTEEPTTEQATTEEPTTEDNADGEGGALEDETVEADKEQELPNQYLVSNSVTLEISNFSIYQKNVAFNIDLNNSFANEDINTNNADRTVNCVYEIYKGSEKVDDGKVSFTGKEGSQEVKTSVDNIGVYNIRVYLENVYYYNEEDNTTSPAAISAEGQFEIIPSEYIVSDDAIINISKIDDIEIKKNDLNEYVGTGSFSVTLDNRLANNAINKGKKAKFEYSIILNGTPMITEQKEIENGNTESVSFNLYAGGTYTVKAKLINGYTYDGSQIFEKNVETKDVSFNALTMDKGYVIYDGVSINLSNVNGYYINNGREYKATYEVKFNNYDYKKANYINRDHNNLFENSYYTIVDKNTKEVIEKKSLDELVNKKIIDSKYDGESIDFTFDYTYKNPEKVSNCEVIVYIPYIRAKVEKVFHLFKGLEEETKWYYETFYASKDEKIKLYDEYYFDQFRADADKERITITDTQKDVISEDGNTLTKTYELKLENYNTKANGTRPLRAKVEFINDKDNSSNGKVKTEVVEFKKDEAVNIDVDFKAVGDYRVVIKYCGDGSTYTKKDAQKDDYFYVDNDFYYNLTHYKTANFKTEQKYEQEVDFVLSESTINFAEVVTVKDNSTAKNPGRLVSNENIEINDTNSDEKTEVSKNNRNILKRLDDNAHTYRAVEMNNSQSTTIVVYREATTFYNKTGMARLALNVKPINVNFEIIPNVTNIDARGNIETVIEIKGITDEARKLLVNDSNVKITYKVQGNKAIKEKVITATKKILEDGLKYVLDLANISEEKDVKAVNGETLQVEAAFSYAREDSPYIFTSNETDPISIGSTKTTLNLYNEENNDGEFEYRVKYQDNIELNPVLEGSKLGTKEKKNIEFVIDIDNEKVIKLADKSATYDATVEAIPFTVVGCGEAVISVTAEDKNEQYGTAQKSFFVNVTNSEIRVTDYVVSASNSSNVKDLDTLKSFLDTQNNWINGNVKININPNDNYYTSLGYSFVDNGELVAKSGLSEILIDKASAKTQYNFWLENKATGATTKDVGTNPGFEVGIDKNDPIIKVTEYESNASVEGNSTEAVRFFGDTFGIKVNVLDKESGIKKVQYSLDAGKTWKEVTTFEAKKQQAEYSFDIELTHGSYKGIVIKVEDVACNVKTLNAITDADGNLVEIVVDDVVPEIALEVKADNQEYTGAWTNKDISVKMYDESSKDMISGIDYFEIKYVTVGNTFENSTWKKFTEEDYPDYTVILNEDNHNGTYYFRATSKAGHISEVVSQRVKLQKEMVSIVPIDTTQFPVNSKNEWYNRKSGVPTIEFSYPAYRVDKNEYDAPITLNYELSVSGADEEPEFVGHYISRIGINSEEEYEKVLLGYSGNNKFIVPQDKISDITIDFGKKNDGTAVDGIYELKYWIEDEAGNKSEVLKSEYKIDTHEPTELVVLLNGNEDGNLVKSSDVITYDFFYNKAVTGTASAQYGVSKKDTLKVLKAKAIDDWKNNDSWILLTDDKNSFEIAPCNRCFIYVVAEDVAGNTTEGWTNGIIVDNEIPAGLNAKELVVEPSGANKNGFYNADIKVPVDVQDLPMDDNFAGIEKVTYVVGKGDKTTENKDLFTFTKEKPTLSDIQSARKYESVQIIDAKNNESNNAYVEVTVLDRAGNTSTTTQKLKIDVTKPVIDVTFDNEVAEHDTYYKADRVATIHVTELNFDSKQVVIKITKDGKDFFIEPSNWSDNGLDHYATIRFSEDGDYTMSVECTDLADNKSEVFNVSEFTVDKTLPTLEVTYNNNKDYKDNYFDAARTATIKVVEHNFIESQFTLDANPAMTISGWNHDGDVHTTTLSFTKDGDYTFKCNVKDLAGNEMVPMNQESFVIDTVAPEVTISGVENESANAGDIAPVVKVKDTNFDIDGVTIKVTTGRGGVVNATIGRAAIDGGYSFILSDMNSMKDDIYYLEAIGTDKAGNSSSVKYRFSLNRHGSTYDISDMSYVVDKRYIQFSDIKDMKIVEMNVDTIDNFSVYISRNGEMLTSKQVESRPTKIDKNIIYYSTKSEGDNNKGYTYTYTIYRENFEQEGEYNIAFYSKDKAGNEINNTLTEKGADIHFIVDNTVPTVIIEGIESGVLYNADVQEVNVCVTDNFKLKDAEFTLVTESGYEIKNWNYLDLAGEGGNVVTLSIPASEEKMTLLYRAVDAAGNEVITMDDSKEAPKAFIVTTDVWVQLKNSKKAKRAAAGAAGAAGTAGVGAAVILKRKKKYL